MKLFVACDVLKEQVERLGLNAGMNSVYLRQGLHRTPKILTEELQKVIEDSPQYETIILGYGLCSRAVIGLKGREHQKLVIPRIDDCIGIVMGSRERYYREFRQNPGTYYFTKGWVEAGEDSLKEYHRTVEKYGKETAEWTIRENLKHYQRTTFICSGDEEEEAKCYAQEFAEFFHLRYEEMDGSPAYLKKLLKGPWDEDFVVVEQGKEFSDEMFQTI